jgi:hypothetical protein
MLKRFLYLDAVALADYLSALEGGLRDGESHRHSTGGKGQGTIEARIIKAGGERSHEEEVSFSVSETPQSRFERLLKLARADPELSGWVDVLDAEEHLPGVGIGAMVSLECEIYVPDVVRTLSSGDLTRFFDLVDTLEPSADAIGLDTTGLPSREARDGIRGFAENVSARLVIVGEPDDSAWRIAGDLQDEFVQGDPDGRAMVVGKVARQWPAGQWKPLLALPGSSMLPRKKRRELERTRPKEGQEDQYLEGPALMLDVLAIYR